MARAKLIMVGDKSKAYCTYCDAKVTTTYKRGKLKFKEHLIPNVLQGYCDKCAKGISLPYSSSFVIKAFNDGFEAGKASEESNKTNSVVTVTNKEL